ncbi:MAG: arylesterase [Candidatus Nitrotoga sp.]|nr:arylesterase [Candidatus Nitrotoga sp.]MDP1638150.1 arylesterase [Candidatus Nitrotoga sp.]MDP1856502.1 arylesterase [Candidatus Nitrotoga sp.]MDP3497522.1 arylesterase [Candidatus Nitrotoga sp.]
MKFSTFFKSILLCACCLLSGVSGAQQQTILVFGDSLSAAYGIPRASGWVNLLQQELQRSHPQYKVVNASISGETTSGGRQRIAPALRQHSPDIVILELGANDGLRGTPIADIENNLSAIIQQSQKGNGKVLLVGIQLPPNYGKNYTDQFKALYSRLAQRHKLELVPFMLKNVQPEQFQADNLHPTAAAQALILQTILDKLKPLLKAKNL